MAPSRLAVSAPVLARVRGLPDEPSARQSRRGRRSTQWRRSSPVILTHVVWQGAAVVGPLSLIRLLPRHFGRLGLRPGAAERPIGGFVAARQDGGSLQTVRIFHVVACRLEPLAAQACRMRHPQHRVQNHARMLGRPGSRVTAVDRFVSAAQVFALVPQHPGNVRAARQPLEVDPRRHEVGRKQRVPVRAPRVGPAVRPC